MAAARAPSDTADTRPDLRDFDVPGDVGAGLAWLYRAQDDFADAFDALSDESAFQLRPAHWGEAVPVVRLVTSMLTEHVHHIAEIGVLRDLHRGYARSQPPPPPTPAPAPQWWLATPGRLPEPGVDAARAVSRRRRRGV
jgi:hypothetical protein